MSYRVGGPIHHVGPDMARKRGKLEVLKEKEVSQSASCENLNKVNNDSEKKSSDDYKMTDESPTSAIDADEIIMRSKRNCGQAEKKSAKGNSQSAEKSFSLTSLHKQVNKLRLPAAAAATGDCLPECEEPKMDKLPVAQMAPAQPPESASASTSTACSHSEVSTPAEDSLEPPPSKDVFPLAKSAFAPAKGGQVVPPPRSLDDNNFLLLAECARVVRDTMALRGVQVCAQQTPIPGSFADF